MLIPWKLLCEGSEETATLSARLVEASAADPLIFDEIMRGILQPDPCIKIQAAEMLEKITRVRPLFLTPYKRLLIKEIGEIELVKVRQQVALLYGRGVWDEWDMQQVVGLLGTWIENEEDESIVMNAIHSLHILAMQKEWIYPIFSQRLQSAIEHTSLLVQEFAAKLKN